jgi:aspartyl-tRNA(Asn)/glutamyl-tRNA(Gln) amidotransferase subunit C
MATSIDNMINWFSILDKLDTEGIEPIFNPLELFQSTLINLREDKIAEGNMQDLILKNTQHKEDVFITVPKVIE